MKNFVFLIFLMVLFCLSSTAKQNPGDDYMEQHLTDRDFDRDKLESLSDDRDYYEELEVPQGMDMRNAPRMFTLPPYVTYILYGLGIALLVAVLVFLFKDQIFGNRKLKKEVSLIDLEDLDEEGFKETELERFLREALESRDYRLAIRIYYLMIIQGLVKSGMIKWKKDKTNLEYLRELRSRAIYDDMRDTTLDFERVWYGEVMVDLNRFESLQPKFKSLLSKIGSTK